MPKRQGGTSTYAGKRWTIDGRAATVLEYYNSETHDDELIWSNGHYGYQDLSKQYDCGGAFRVAYNRTSQGSCDVGSIQGGHAYQEYRYTGSVYTGLNHAQSPGWVDSSNLGSTAYRRMKPDKPNMNAFVAIYELKDVPEMLHQRFTGSGLHEIGDYYLALKFGWEPLLKDIRSFVQTHINAQNRLKQLIRDEGRPIKRRVTLNDSSVEYYTASGSGNYLNPSFVSYFYADGGSYHSRAVTQHKIWASARFRYWLPLGPRDVNWTNRMKARIFGLNPTPSSIYQVIPWTWLAGWFTNVGDMIDNLNTTLVDRCAADYFYLMDNIENRLETTCNSTYLRQETLEPVKASATGVFANGSKTRWHGDPDGYGTPENSLSGVQLSILGALGLSRLR